MSKPKGYWTEARVKAEALKYGSRGEFKAAEPVAYLTARKKKILDEVCGHMEAQRRTLSLEQLAAIAAQYETRGAFAGADSSAYCMALRKGWLDAICLHMVQVKLPKGSWTRDMVLQEAAKYKNHTDFQDGSPGAHRAAQRFDMIAEVRQAANWEGTARHFWTFERCKQVAAKYEHRGEFQRCDVKAYTRASRRGWLDKICAHMTPVRYPPDSIYVWEALGETYHGKRIYKLGVTTARLGAHRIETVAHQNQMDAKIKVLRWVGEHYALTLEQHLLSFGENPKLDVTQGKTEFRALTDEELQVIIKIIESHPIL